MSMRHNKFAIIIASISEILFIVMAVINYDTNQINKLILAAVCILIPFVITTILNKKKIILPAYFEVVCVVFFLLTQYFGEILKFYIRFFWWDLLLHGFFGSYAVVVAWSVMHGTIAKEDKITNERFYVMKSLFACAFSIALGALWEMFEFAGDYFLKTNMVKGGLKIQRRIFL